MMDDFTGFISVRMGTYESVDWNEGKKVRPGGYSARLDPTSQVYLAAGVVSDAGFLYGAGAVRLLDVMLAEGLVDVSEEFRLRIVCTGSGIDGQVARLLRQWQANGGRNSRGEVPKNYQTWQRLGVLSSLGWVQFVKPTVPQEVHSLSMVHIFASHESAKAGSAPKGFYLNETIL